VTTIPGSPTTPREARAALDEFEGLFDALLFAVAHDLKSPLLSISLGAELLESAPSAALDDRTRLALEAMKRGTEDLARQLEAVTLISRARRRPLDARPLPLIAALPQVSSAPGIAGVSVAVDARLLTEFVTALDSALIEARAGTDEVRLTAPWPASAPACEGPPLEALLASLGTHAGTLLATLAALQVQLERQGGTIVVAGGVVTVLLPRA
jgi:hypothetical protein